MMMKNNHIPKDEAGRPFQWQPSKADNDSRKEKSVRLVNQYKGYKLIIVIMLQVRPGFGYWYRLFQLFRVAASSNSMISASSAATGLCSTPFGYNGNSPWLMDLWFYHAGAYQNFPSPRKTIHLHESWWLPDKLPRFHQLNMLSVQFSRNTGLKSENCDSFSATFTFPCDKDKCIICGRMNTKGCLPPEAYPLGLRNFCLTTDDHRFTQIFTFNLC